MAQAAACSYPTNESPYPGNCATLQIVSSVPASGGEGVPTDVTFRIAFDDYPDPDTVRSSTLLLTTGYFWVPGTYGVDLISKAAVMRPIRPLVSGLGYALHLRPALSSLRGCTGPNEEIEFITGDGPAGAPPPEPPPFTDVQAIFASRCAGGCHLGSDDDAEACLTEPAAGLSLCAADAWKELVAVRSREVEALRLAEPNDSARSYLLRKLIPDGPTGGPIPGTIGQREPPGDPLPEEQLRLIAAWIDGGALR